SFILSALLFVGLLTLLVRVARFPVRKELPRKYALLLTCGFVALALGLWWFVTHGARYEDRIVNPTILASPREMLKAFAPLHIDQALVRNALRSIGRISLGFSMAVFLGHPLGAFFVTLAPPR